MEYNKYSVISVQATDKISVRDKSKQQSRIQFAMSVAETEILAIG